MYYELTDQFEVAGNIDRCWQFFGTASNLPLIHAALAVVPGRDARPAARDPPGRDTRLQDQMGRRADQVEDTHHRLVPAAPVHRPPASRSVCTMAPPAHLHAG